MSGASVVISRKCGAVLDEDDLQGGGRPPRTQFPNVRYAGPLTKSGDADKRREVVTASTVE
jgi:hypothetical protein